MNRFYLLGALLAVTVLVGCAKSDEFATDELILDIEISADDADLRLDTKLLTYSESWAGMPTTLFFGGKDKLYVSYRDGADSVLLADQHSESELHSLTLDRSTVQYLEFYFKRKKYDDDRVFIELPQPVTVESEAFDLGLTTDQLTFDLTITPLDDTVRFKSIDLTCGQESPLQSWAIDKMLVNTTQFNLEEIIDPSGDEGVDYDSQLKGCDLQLSFNNTSYDYLKAEHLEEVYLRYSNTQVRKIHLY